MKKLDEAGIAEESVVQMASGLSRYCGSSARTEPPSMAPRKTLKTSLKEREERRGEKESQDARRRKKLENEWGNLKEVR